MNIFVGNFPPETSEDDLRLAFEPFGEVTSVQIITEKFTGESRGFGFVAMHSKTEAQAAIDSLNGKEFKGRPLNVNEARPRTRPSFSSGRGRGDSRRRDAKRRGGNKRGGKRRGGWGY